MSQPMIIWCLIAGVLLVAFISRAVRYYLSECRHDGRKPRHFIEMGKERDMFFIPGDVDVDDEFDDL